MENSQAKLSPEDVFNNKKLFSKKVHTRVLKVIEDVSKSFDNLKIVNDEDKKLFLNTVDHYYHDLCAVIFYLRQVVIKINDVDQSVRDLQNVITELNNIIILVQECLNSGMEKLKIQLKGTIIKVGSQVEKLMEIIEYDNLHEHKQKVLDCQHDLVISVEALRFYCQISYLGPPELERILHEIIDKIKNNLIEIKSDHEHHEDDFSHFTRRYAQSLQNVVDDMRKTINTNVFQKDMANSFNNAEACAVKSGRELLEAIRYDNPMKKILELIESTHAGVTKGSLELQIGLQAAKINNIGKEENEHAQQLIMHMFLNVINAMNALHLSIEDAIVKK